MASKNTTQWLARYWPRFLLIISVLLVAWVPFYNRVEPKLGGVPFFYWYQLAAILLSAAIVFIVYLLEVRITRGRAATAADLDSSGTPGDIL
jgi:hypothetical protein